MCNQDIRHFVPASKCARGPAANTPTIHLVSMSSLSGHGISSGKQEHPDKIYGYPIFKLVVTTPLKHRESKKGSLRRLPGLQSPCTKCRLFIYSPCHSRWFRFEVHGKQEFVTVCYHQPTSWRWLQLSWHQIITMGLLPDTLNCRLRMRREYRKRFPPPPISKETAS